MLRFNRIAFQTARCNCIGIAMPLASRMLTKDLPRPTTLQRVATVLQPKNGFAGGVEVCVRHCAQSAFKGEEDFSPNV